ncbi:J domain-containing protein [Actinomarinicola tropica]|nr:J domain-containing protein [Actinomarinicola tropica]
MSKRWPFGRKRDEGEQIHIAGDQGHGWWADRDALEATIDRRWRRQAPDGHPRRRASDRTGHDARGDRVAPSPGFAPSDAGQPTDRWDPAALFTDTATIRAESAATADADGDEVLTTREAGSPWSALGLSSDASWGEVVRRHRQLAKRHHPDRAAPDDPDGRRRAEEQMTAINAAFHDLRRIYRLTGSR